MLPGPVPKPAIERFNAMYVPVPESGCWLWLGGCVRKGYGKFYWNQKRGHIFAHRASYLLHKGQPNEGAWILHKCDTPSCVNPDHLFAGSAQDNTNDMIAKRRERFPKYLATCGRGHSVFKVRPDGRRYCVECHRIYERRRK